MVEPVYEYEVDYRGNIISVLPKPRTSYPPVTLQPVESLPLEELLSDLGDLDFCICDYCSCNNETGCVISNASLVHGSLKPTFYCKMFYYHEINEDGHEISYFMGE